jgi:hypothetical protein
MVVIDASCVSVDLSADVVGFFVADTVLLAMVMAPLWWDGVDHKL